MPWTFAGSKSARGKTAKKKGQIVSRRRPNMGRSLVNSGIADMLREEREFERMEAAAKVKTTPPKPAPVTVVTKATVKTTTVVTTNKAKAKAAPKPVSPLPASATNPRAIDFLNFILRLPEVTPDWDNNDTRELLQHTSESTLVFSFKFATPDGTGTPTFIVGSTMYSRNKLNRQLVRKCQAVMHIKDGKIIKTWTNWVLNTDTNRMRPGMFVWMLRDFISSKKVEKSRVCVLNNEYDLHRHDLVCGLDWRHDFTHYVFQQNDWFPFGSGW